MYQKPLTHKYKKITLLLIILMAATLRAYHIYSAPRLPDEICLVWSRNLTYLPSVFSLKFCNLPLHNLILFIGEWLFFSVGYLLGYFHSVLDFDTRRITDIETFLLIGRTLDILFGVATVYIVYLIGKKFKNEETGLIGALFLAFMYPHIEYSRYAHYIVPVVFFAMLPCLFLLSLIFNGRLKHYILSGFFIGFGGAVKYTAFFMIAPFLLAHALRMNALREHGRKQNIQRIVLGLLFIPVGFICGYPSIFFEFKTFLANVRHYFVVLMIGWPPDMIPTHGAWIDYSHIIYQEIGFGMLIIFLCGLGYCFIKKQKEDILIASCPVFFYICLGSLHNLTPYYIMPILPFMALIGAYFLVRLISLLRLEKTRNIFLFLLSTLFIIEPGIKIYKSGLYTPIKNKQEIINEFISQYVSEGIKLLDSNGKLVDNIPIIFKIGETFFAPVFKEPLMNTYKGQSVQISGRVIFKEYKEGIITVSLRSKEYYPSGPPDIAFITMYSPGEYCIGVPIGSGEVIIRASFWPSAKSQHPQYCSKDIYLKIKKTNIDNVDLFMFPSL